MQYLLMIWINWMSYIKMMNRFVSLLYLTNYMIEKNIMKQWKVHSTVYLLSHIRKV